MLKDHPSFETPEMIPEENFRELIEEIDAMKNEDEKIDRINEWNRQVVGRQQEFEEQLPEDDPAEDARLRQAVDTLQQYHDLLVEIHPGDPEDWVDNKGIDIQKDY